MGKGWIGVRNSDNLIEVSVSSEISMLGTTDCACALSDPASFNPKQGHEFFFIVAVKFSGSPEFTLELILVSEVDQFVESNVKAHIIIAAWRASPTLLVMQESFVDSPHSRESIIGIGRPVCQKRTDGANHG